METQETKKMTDEDATQLDWVFLDYLRELIFKPWLYGNETADRGRELDGGSPFANQTEKVK